MRRYQDLLQRSGANPDDVERSALLYILAYNKDLYAKADKIYDFVDGSIKTNCLGYSNWEIEENLNMGGKSSKRCAICQRPLEGGEASKCSVCADIPDLCTTSKNLIKLGFNLFNGYSEGECDVKHLLGGLGRYNFEIAMKAIRIRFRVRW
jgi:hypothetical protein